MAQPRKPGSSNIWLDDSIEGLPAVVLLDEKQWFYIKKRYRLSPRELQVARLVCQGFSNEQIASMLKIRHGTAKTHLRNIYRRIRVKSKIKMLLKFVNTATKFSAKSRITPPVPIVEVKKPGKKSSTSSNIPRKK